MTRWGKAAYRSQVQSLDWVPSKDEKRKKAEHISEGNSESNDPKLTPKEYFRLFFNVRGKTHGTGTGEPFIKCGAGEQERERAGPSGFLWVPKSHAPNWSSLLKVMS